MMSALREPTRSLVNRLQGVPAGPSNADVIDPPLQLPRAALLDGAPGVRSRQLDESGIGQVKAVFTSVTYGTRCVRRHRFHMDSEQAVRDGSDAHER
jgi:hypothetical protein